MLADDASHQVPCTHKALWALLPAFVAKVWIIDLALSSDQASTACQADAIACKTRRDFADKSQRSMGINTSEDLDH